MLIKDNVVKTLNITLFSLLLPRPRSLLLIKTNVWQKRTRGKIQPSYHPMSAPVSPNRAPVVVSNWPLFPLVGGWHCQVTSGASASPAVSAMGSGRFFEDGKNPCRFQLLILSSQLLQWLNLEVYLLLSVSHQIMLLMTKQDLRFWWFLEGSISEVPSSTKWYSPHCANRELLRRR